MNTALVDCVLLQAQAQRDELVDGTAETTSEPAAPSGVRRCLPPPPHPSPPHARRGTLAAAAPMRACVPVPAPDVRHGRLHADTGRLARAEHGHEAARPAPVIGGSSLVMLEGREGNPL